MATKNELQSTLGQLDETLHLYLVEKAPQIPPAWKEIIVKIAPWLTLISVIITIPALLIVLGLGAVVAPFSFLAGAQSGVGFMMSLLALVFLLPVVVLEAMAIPGLFNRKMSAWRLVYYSTLISGVQNIISFNIGGLLIGTLLGLYILFQVKEYYK